jgi:TolA-binding protein
MDGRIAMQISIALLVLLLSAEIANAQYGSYEQQMRDWQLQGDIDELEDKQRRAQQRQEEINRRLDDIERNMGTRNYGTDYLRPYHSDRRYR